MCVCVCVCVCNSISMCVLHRITRQASGSEVQQLRKEMNDPLKPFGTDPVFVVGKELYNPLLVGREGEFYNMSLSSDDVGATGWPRLFHSRPLEGRPEGFPVLVPTTSDKTGAAKLLGALQEGAFLDPLSREVSIDLVSLNQLANMMSYATAVIHWDDSGSILLKNTHIRTLPVYSASNVMSVLIPLLLILLCVAHVLITDHLPEIFRLVMSRATACCSPGLRYGRMSPRSPSRRKKGMGEVAFDLLTLGILVAALAFSLLAAMSSRMMSLQTSYRVYDTVATPAARFFLRAKEPQDTSASENDPRWMAENDDTGLEEFGSLVHDVRMASAQHATSGILLSCVLIMAVFRAIHLWSFKVELGLFFRVLVEVLPDVVHLLLVMLFAMLGLAAAGNMLLGPEVWTFSSPSKAMYYLFQVFLIGDMGTLLSATNHSQEERIAITAVAMHVFLVMVPVLLCFVFFQFFIAIILEKFYACKVRETEKKSDGPADRPLVDLMERVGFHLHRQGSSPKARSLLRRVVKPVLPSDDDDDDEDDVLRRLRTRMEQDTEEDEILVSLKTKFGHEADGVSKGSITKLNHFGGSIWKMLPGSNEKRARRWAAGDLFEVHKHIQSTLEQVLTLNKAIQETAAMAVTLEAKEVECEWLFQRIAIKELKSIPLPSAKDKTAVALPGQLNSSPIAKKSIPRAPMQTVAFNLDTLPDSLEEHVQAGHHGSILHCWGEPHGSPTVTHGLMAGRRRGSDSPLEHQQSQRKTVRPRNRHNKGRSFESDGAGASSMDRSNRDSTPLKQPRRTTHF